MSQQFIIPPRTTDGNEIRKFFQRVCQLINQGMEVDNSIARAYLTANQAINHGEATTVVGYTESTDVGGNFNPVTGIYTASVDGKYHISWTILYYDVQAKLVLASSQVLYNDAVFATGSYWSGTDKTYVGSSGSDIIAMDAGGTIKLAGYIQTSDSSAAVMNEGNYTKLAIHLIARA